MIMKKNLKTRIPKDKTVCSLVIITLNLAIRVPISDKHYLNCPFQIFSVQIFCFLHYCILFFKEDE